MGEMSTKAISSTTAWRLKNPEKYAAMKEAYRAKQNAANKAYYERNRKRIIARQLAYDKANAKTVREYRKAWRAANADKQKPYMVAWRQNNQSLCQFYHRNRRARIVGNGGVASKDIADKLFKLQKGKCASCRCCLKSVKQHLDHIVALANGGGNNDENLQLLCAKCNLQKKDRCPVEFMQSKGYLL